MRDDGIDIFLILFLLRPFGNFGIDLGPADLGINDLDAVDLGVVDLGVIGFDDS